MSVRIDRAEKGRRWFVVDALIDGRRIIHSGHNDLASAIEYLRHFAGREPTAEELAQLMRDDLRVTFRQRHKRKPTDEELAALEMAADL